MNTEEYQNNDQCNASPVHERYYSNLIRKCDSLSILTAMVILRWIYIMIVKRMHGNHQFPLVMGYHGYPV